MPSGYWGGLVEGFSARRNEQIQQRQAEDAARRAQESKLYEYLLQSEDPEIKSLALSGLFESAQPGKRKGGMAGFLGEIQGGQVYPMIRARMDEYVPVPPRETGGPSPATSPGAAAMPSTSPVTPGSAPIPPAAAQPSIPQAPADYDGEWGPPPGMAQAGPATPPAMTPPPAPPPSQFKRRGTGIPTAEEIAEMQARVGLETRIKTATQQLTLAGATDEEVETAIMGMLGAPRNQRSLQAVNSWGVKIPGSDIVQPVLLDTTGKGYVLAGGQPLPPGAQMVRMTGGTGAGAGLTSRIEDGPEAVAYFTQLGATPEQIALVAAGSPSGAWEYRQRQDGTLEINADIYTDPTRYTAVPSLDASGNAVIRPFRNTTGTLGPVIANAPNPQPSVDQSNAKALLAEVEATITSMEAPRAGGMRTRLTPQLRDQIVRDAAVKAGLPYQSYYDLQAATGVSTARQVAPQPNAPPAAGPTQNPPASMVDRIRQRALEIQQGGGRTPPPVRSAPPPAKPPARAGGAGPR